MQSLLLTRIEQVRAAILPRILSGPLRPRAQVDLMRRAGRGRNVAKWRAVHHIFHHAICRPSGSSFAIRAGEVIVAAPFAYRCNRPQELPAGYLSMTMAAQAVEGD